MIPLHKVFTPPGIGFERMMDELSAVLASGWVGEGPKVAEFEAALRPIVGSDNVTALNSCTSALTMALRIAGVGQGHEVITTAMTCTATNLPILLAGAIPVWADVDPDTGNISPVSIRLRITPRTKAIMVVHWGGELCAMDAIGAIAREFNLKVIEDAAHAFGSSYRGAPIGSHSDFVCFSFQAIKHIHTGDGGLLVCRSMVDHARARSLKWFGIDRERRTENALGYAEWNVVEPGYKFHMNDVAATIGLAQLPYLSEILEARSANATAYRAAFQDLTRVQSTHHIDGNQSADWLYTVIVDDQIGFIRHLKEHGIASSVVHMRNDQGAMFAPYRRDDLPGLDFFASHMVCIPVGQWVGDAEREKIINVVSEEKW